MSDDASIHESRHESDVQVASRKWEVQEGHMKYRLLDESERESAVRNVVAAAGNLYRMSPAEHLEKFRDAFKEKPLVLTDVDLTATKGYFDTDGSPRLNSYLHPAMSAEFEAQGLISQQVVEEIKTMEQEFKAGKVPYGEAALFVNEHLLRALRGKEKSRAVEACVRLAKRVILNEKGPYGEGIYSDFRNDGFIFGIVSGIWSTLSEAMMITGVMPHELAIVTRPEFARLGDDRTVFTGEWESATLDQYPLLFNNSVDKYALFDMVMECYDVDLKGSYGFGDSTKDRWTDRCDIRVGYQRKPGDTFGLYVLQTKGLAIPMQNDNIADARQALRKARTRTQRRLDAQPRT